MNIIRVDALYKAFRQGFWGRRNEVLKGLSFAVEKGEVFGFLGHNGAGKTTTFKLLLGLLRPNSGDISVFSPGAASGDDRARIGFLSEDIGLYPYLNAAEMLQLVGELFRMRRPELKARIIQLIEAVGLEQHRALKIGRYSKGMRQRLGIAAALINDPELLILDEPYSGLDPAGRKQLRELLLNLKSQGKTILLSSHIVPDVEAVCDRVGILSGGKIVRTLDLNEVFEGRTDEVEVTVTGVSSEKIPAGRGGIEPVVKNDRMAILRCSGSDKVKSLVSDVYSSDGSVLEIRPLKSGLEEIFVKETSKLAEERTEDEQRNADEMAFTE